MRISPVLQRIAKERNVPPHIVEKDYVIGWILRGLWKSGIYNDLVFKGGTCLKKVYFRNYRFSEDLDFNLSDGPSVLDDLSSALASSPPMPEDLEFMDIEVKERKGVRYKAGEVVGYEVKVPYRLLRKSGDASKIKMDLTLTVHEPLYLPVRKMPIFHDYDDEVSMSLVRVRAYSLEEILAEKIRTLFQRTGRPRDIYDIWRIFNDTDVNKALSILPDKFTIKGVEFSPDALMDKKPIYEANWRTSMPVLVRGNDLPDFDTVWRCVENIIKLASEVMDGCGLLDGEN